MKTLVIAEKPSVARDLARVIGASQRGEGCLQGGGYVVTWAIGHLVGLAQAEPAPALTAATTPGPLAAADMDPCSAAVFSAAAFCSSKATTVLLRSAEARTRCSWSMVASLESVIPSEYLFSAWDFHWFTM